MNRSTGIPHVAILLPYILATTTSATEYKATLLPAAEYNYSEANGVSNSRVVGVAAPAGGGFGHAMLWNSMSNSPIDLNPAGYRFSRAIAASDNIQVGYGEGPSTDHYDHALLWTGTAESVIDLHPAGFNFSYLYDATQEYQVGFASIGPPGPDSQALMWHGTAASAMMLPVPSGYWSTRAVAAHGDSQVGSGLTTITGTYGYHALLWHGPAASVIDLNPPGWAGSVALAVNGGSQVGIGNPGVDGPYHAMLWNSTAAGAIDLTPNDSFYSEATDVANGIQVGWGSGATVDGEIHALLWNGTAESVVDLHQSLSNLGLRFHGSEAWGVADNGTIVGTAYTDQSSYAVMWTPILEPSTFSLLTIATAILGRCRAHRFSIQ
jgi:hypothetical protein